jgi:hypothetical protein
LVKAAVPSPMRCLGISKKKPGYLSRQPGYLSETRGFPPPPSNGFGFLTVISYKAFSIINVKKKMHIKDKFFLIDAMSKDAG